MTQQNKFLAMWDCNGLECLIDITDLEGDAMMAGLKGESYKVPFNLSMMLLRARVNSQRSYEIYSFTTDSTLGYDEVKAVFEDDPQTIVDLIRKQGNMIFSDYTTKKKVIS